ncbi:MAG: ribonuclease P protein subunit [Candidatus Thorarchaeota archaeon]|nr:ribonuclease P protein subunit [Candidatus Thorarchaeota archaeon]
MITPQNLLNHEIVGLPVHIAQSNDSGLVSRRGSVVGETKETLLVETPTGVVRIAKRVCVLDFTINNDTVVRVRGSLLRGRSEERLKKRLGRSE